VWWEVRTGLVIAGIAFLDLWPAAARKIWCASESSSWTAAVGSASSLPWENASVTWGWRHRTDQCQDHDRMVRRRTRGRWVGQYMNAMAMARLRTILDREMTMAGCAWRI
jgi:hypothetical protein